jgi:hypothetical protein
VKEKSLVSTEQRSSVNFFKRMLLVISDQERRAYLVLAAFMVVLTLVAGTFTIVQNHILEHKFCQLIDASIQTPAKKPVNPKLAPAQEKNYEDYVIVSNLDRSLGCSGANYTGG